MATPSAGSRFGHTGKKRAEDTDDMPEKDEEAKAPEASEEPEAGEDEDKDMAATDTSARADERKRCAAIMNSPHAKGREDLAKKLAFSTDMDVKQAVGLLEAAPKAEAGGGRLDKAMVGQGQEPLSSDGGEESADHGWGATMKAVNKERGF